MEVAALALGALLAIVAVLFVARPLLRDSAGDALPAADHAGEERLRLLEERDRALAALKELELDHRTGKIGDEDYRALVRPLRREVGAVLRALEGAASAEREQADVPG